MLRRRTQQTLKPIRTIVLGKDGVGKSALVVRLLTGRFIGEYDQSLEQTYRHHVEVDSEDIPLDISDTAGENSDEKLRQCCRQGDLFLVLYSITDRSSFEEAKRIVRFVKECRNADSLATVLVATKCDLDHFRKVEFEEGSDFSTQLDCTFHEISTSEDYRRVQEVVRSSLRDFMRDRHKRETSGLRVPSLAKRTPSFEKKKRSARGSQENVRATVRPFEIRPRMRRKEEGDGSVADDKANNNFSAVDAKRNDTNHMLTPLIRVNGVSKNDKKQGPFNLENVKNAASSRERNKLPSPTGKAADTPSNEKRTIPFTVHKVKGSSASEWMRPLPVNQLRAPTSNYWTEESIPEEKPKQTSKGPFSMDRLRSQSTEKLRSSSSNDRSRATSSFTRMKDGLIGRTKSLRRKPIYL